MTTTNELVKRLRAVAVSICERWNDLPVAVRDGANSCGTAADTIEHQQSAIRSAITAMETLLSEAEGFNVSGVYFDEPCMGHKGPALVKAAIVSLRTLAGET